MGSSCLTLQSLIRVVRRLVGELLLVFGHWLSHCEECWCGLLKSK
uniref:Uncharacterized protein n=1 Tax=Fusarium oxysporum (strain Fo5176) TaxID=660025 RepID=A0A0D2XQ12_FUSOF